MHKTFLTVLAAATIAVIAMPIHKAAATASATPQLAGVPSSPLVREAAIVCGGNGCNPVHTRAQKRSKFKPLDYTKPVAKTS
jgi:hypothetical protein